MHANLVILGLISDLGLYYNHDSVPMMLFMSLGKFGNVADSANSQLKSYLQEIDRNDKKLVDNLFRLIKNENIYQTNILQSQ